MLYKAFHIQKNTKKTTKKGKKGKEGKEGKGGKGQKRADFFPDNEKGFWKKKQRDSFLKKIFF